MQSSSQSPQAKNSTHLSWLMWVDRPQLGSPPKISTFHLPDQASQIFEAMNLAFPTRSSAQMLAPCSISLRAKVSWASVMPDPFCWRTTLTCLPKMSVLTAVFFLYSRSERLRDCCTSKESTLATSRRRKIAFIFELNRLQFQEISQAFRSYADFTMLWASDLLEEAFLWAGVEAAQSWRQGLRRMDTFDIRPYYYVWRMWKPRFFGMEEVFALRLQTSFTVNAKSHHKFSNRPQNNQTCQPTTHIFIISLSNSQTPQPSTSFPFLIYNTTCQSINQMQMPEACEQCRQKEKQFRVLQVQLQFQIKKLNEDMAHQKLTLEMAHQKECKKLAEKIAFTKNERELENKSWMEKYDAMTQLYEERLRKTQQKCELVIGEAKHQMASKQQASTQESELRLKREIVAIKEENEDYKKKLLVSKEEEKKYLAKVHEEEVVKIVEKHKAEVQSILQEKLQLEDTLAKREIAQRSHEMVVFELKEEIHAKKGEVDGLKERIHTLQNKIKIYFQPEIHNREKEVSRLKKQQEKACARLKEEGKAEREKLIKDFNKNIEQLLEKQLKRCVDYEQKLKELDQQREKQLAFYHRSLEEVRSAAEERLMPKSQFHEQISTLKVRLTSKEKDIERAKEQIKQCKLQIENNEEMLNKFFRTSNHNTAPDIFLHTPNATASNSKKKDYKIKKNRVSLSGSNFLEVGKASTITSMESLDNSKNFESFRML